MADSHAHHPPEPKTPMWLPALGATLFLLAGIWWAWTTSAQHTEGSTGEAKPAASAHP
jgi:putative SOS response-associated peptidase YedK